MLLDIEGLDLAVPTPDGPTPDGHRTILSGVSLHVGAGETVGLVGESGSGKSTTARAALGLLPDRARLGGRITVCGQDASDPAAVHALRTGTVQMRPVAMIFQEPRAALNPVRRIGDSAAERLVHVHGVSRSAARKKVLALFAEVGLWDGEGDGARLLRRYPHQLSGGMLQRVLIAAALSTEPQLLLADEPTSALDVTTQAEVLALLRRLRGERGMGVLFITHDLHLAAAYCDRVYVMKDGAVVEEQAAADVFTRPRHPYTRALVAAAPHLPERDGVTA